MSIDTRTLRLLPGIEHSGFSVSRDNRVACLRSDSGGKAIVAVDTSPFRIVLRERSLHWIGNSKEPLWPPVWNPTGTSLAFGWEGIWTVSADGQELSKVSARKLWMPAGGRGASGNTNLYPEKNAYLTWLPDGESLLFVERSDPDHVALWQAAVDGSWERKLLGQVRTIQSFAISPSGNRAAAVATDGITSDLFLLDLRPARPAHQVIELGEHRDHAIYRYPRVLWGPDEDWFVFRGTGSGWSKHYRVSLGSEGPRFEPLTTGGRERQSWNGRLRGSSRPPVSPLWSDGGSAGDRLVPWRTRDGRQPRLVPP